MPMPNGLRHIDGHQKLIRWRINFARLQCFLNVMAYHHVFGVIKMVKNLKCLNTCLLTLNEDLEEAAD